MAGTKGINGTEAAWTIEEQRDQGESLSSLKDTQIVNLCCQMTEERGRGFGVKIVVNI